MKIQKRRYFLKLLLSLGFFSIFPFKIKAISQIDECNTTTPDIEGPYYIPNSPNVSILTPPEITSDFLFITGTVYAKDCITPIPNAAVDVWHSNKGELIFDETQGDDFWGNSDYDDTLYRAKIYTDSNGNYAYQTILPGKYLNGSYYRPSHIHYKASYLETNELTTQLYFEGDTTIDIDPWASDSSAENRIIPLAVDKNNNLHGVFDIILSTDSSELPQTNIHEQKIIQSIHPNPINKQTNIYLNHTGSQTVIEICDINGKTINKVNTSNHIIPLYNILPPNLKKGVYIIKVLRKNGLIDAKRFCI